MNASKHTPGPWRVGYDVNDDHTRGIERVVDQRGLPVATAAVRFNADMPMHMDETLLAYTARAAEAGERAANARLIASAPELADALRGVMAVCKSNGWDMYGAAEFALARAALAKVEG